MSLRILTSSDIQTILPLISTSALLGLTSNLFLSLHSDNNNDIVTPPRHSIASSSNTTLFMPSRVGYLHATSIKIVSVPLSASENGLPASTTVLDEQTGGVKALMNARVLTALRTAAGSALATRLLLPPASAPIHLVAFGAGAQIEAHVNLLVDSQPTIQTCTIINRSQNARLRSLISRLQSLHSSIAFISPSALDEIEKAVKRADLIVTATSATSPLVKTDWVKPSAHINLVGSYKPTMHEIEASLVQKASLVVVDSKEACLKEAGELIEAGLKPSQVLELGDLISGQKSTAPGSGKEERITIFKSVGIGAQDVMIAHEVLRIAEEREIGTIVENYDT